MSVTTAPPSPPGAAAPSSFSSSSDPDPATTLASPRRAAHSAGRSSLPPAEAPTPRATPAALLALVREAVLAPHAAAARVPLPMHEPLSELQQRAEDLEYHALLDAAAACAPGSRARLATVAAFAVSAYAGVVRTGKPFAAVLGETFELVVGGGGGVGVGAGQGQGQGGGFRFLAEKVRAAPRPLNHAIAHGVAGWTFELEDELRMKFGASSVELTPRVLVRAAFPDGEAFSWGKVTTTIHNATALVGKMRLEHTGVCTVASALTGEACVLTFHGAGAGPGGRKAAREVSGVVVRGAGAGAAPVAPPVTLDGAWDTSLRAAGLDSASGSPTLLWSSRAATAGGGWAALVAGLGPHNRFGFGPWTAGLNAPPARTCACGGGDGGGGGGESPPPCCPARHAPLPPTDSRLRPDLRALEHGRYPAAAAAKAALEAEEAAKVACGARSPHAPTWFARRGGVEAEVGAAFLYAYRGGYWAAA